jgi:putative nucleotidyltransferase with HDIG domain
MTCTVKKKTRYVFDKISQLAKELGISVYVVGGYVRDLLREQDGLDLDFVVIGNALEFCREFKRRYRLQSFVTYPRFGTCMLGFNNHKLEFVSARVETYNTNSRKPEVKTADLISDLSRRDFTINSIAMNISTEKFGELIDPYNGKEDLCKGLIRTPLQPEQTFSDDPLRMMRAIRFASQFNYKIETSTFEAINHTSNRLTIVSQERITAEFNKILLSIKPSTGFILLDKTGLLRIFFPEFEQTKGVEQRDKFHHKDVFYHTLQVLDQVALMSDKLQLRLAAVFHDIAKPRTKRFSKSTGWTFYGHEVIGEKMSASILHRLKYPKEIITYVKKMVRLHLRPMALVSEEVTDSAIRRLLFLSGEEFDDLMLLCKADITSKNPEKVKRYLKNYQIVIEKSKEVEDKDKLRAFKSPVDGNEIMALFNLTPGPQIGMIKKFIEEAILSGNIPNEHDAALAFLLGEKTNLFKRIEDIRR